MIRTYTHKKLAWLDVESPGNDEIKKLMEEHKIHPETAEELLSPSLKPRVDLYKDYIYLILHFPTIKHTHGTQKIQEIDFIISKNTLITVRYDTIDAVHKFSKVFEVNSILKKSIIGNHAGYLFYHLIKKLYKSLVHELEYTESWLEKIESRIFSGKEKDMVVALSEVSRELIDFKKAISYHAEVLDSLQLAGSEFFDTRFATYLRMVVSEYRRIEDLLRGKQETLLELRETNNSLVSTKQNEAMKVLAIMAFVTFPLSLVASIFGMNTTYLPIVGIPGDFWIVMGIMAVMASVMFWYFKKKHWL